MDTVIPTEVTEATVDTEATETEGMEATAAIPSTEVSSAHIVSLLGTIASAFMETEFCCRLRYVRRVRRVWRHESRNGHATWSNDGSYDGWYDGQEVDSISLVTNVSAFCECLPHFLISRNKQVDKDVAIFHYR